MKVLIIGGSLSYDNMFESRGWELVEHFTDRPDLVQFCGGADVHPSYYGEKMHPKAHTQLSRDKAEEIYFEYCANRSIPTVGICRGAQLINCLNGGKMWQHVDGHAVGQMHEIADMETGVVLSVTSTHHQMMRPHEAAEIIAVTNIAKVKEHMNGDIVVQDIGPSRDFEVVFYKETKSLCFQPHPEFGPGNCQDYYFELIRRKLGLEA